MPMGNGRFEEVVDILYEKVAVLEKAQQGKINDNRNNENDLCLFCILIFINPNTGKKVDKDGKKHQHYINRLTPGVEN